MLIRDEFHKFYLSIQKNNFLFLAKPGKSWSDLETPRIEIGFSFSGTMVFEMRSPRSCGDFFAIELPTMLEGYDSE